MFASNFNPVYHQIQPQYANSIESNSSLGSSSFLAAANTIILNDSPHQTPSNGSKFKNDSISSTILKFQNQSNDLDFDLHYLTENNINLNNVNSIKKKKSESSLVVFKDDDNLFEQDETTDENDEEDQEEYELEDEFPSFRMNISSKNQNTRMPICKLTTMNVPIQDQVNKINDKSTQGSQNKTSNLINNSNVRKLSFLNDSLSPSSQMTGYFYRKKF